MGEILVTGKAYPHIPPFGFQTYFFEELQIAANELNLKLYFADPLQQKKDTDLLTGYKLQNGSWLPIKFKLPQIIYYRFSSAELTEKAVSEKFVQFCQSQGCILANPWPMVQLVNDKWLFHQFLEQNNLAEIPTLQASPRNLEIIKSWLLKYSTLYLKPRNASNGRGVVQLSAGKDGFLYKSADEQKSLNEAMLLNFLKRNDNLIVQPAIMPTYKTDMPFDIRVMIQHNGLEYKVSGMGIRRGKLGSNISNLKGGGEALPIELLSDFLTKEIEENALIQTIAEKCLKVSQILDKTFGSFCELGFDVLLNNEWQPVVLEANANPGRWIFTKIADRYLNRKDVDSRKMWQKYIDTRKRTVSLPLYYLKCHL